MYIGIDLGTTNSVISFAQVTRDGRIRANPIEIERIMDSGTGIEGKVNYTRSRSRTLPSCVYYYEDQIIVGDYAREQYKKYPERVAKSIKSQMGNTTARGLSADVIDKTPEEISARILAHLKGFAQKQIRQQIKDVIITVPANFDTARREATMKAAEKAGFDVREEDGSWKPILISEPNAVLYDLAQKILNGEIAESVLDFSEKKKVLVFDIGGGTLDVTFHELERDPENGVTLNISEIAASRFTQLAGDDFDNAIANELYRRCVEKFSEHEPAAVPRICAREAMVKKLLTVEAERVKMGINSSVDRDLYSAGAVDDWFSDFAEEETEEVTYGVSTSIGDERLYNDTVTQGEFEAMLEPFLGKEYKFEDYRGYSNNRKIRRDNIIAPILDVLEKAARYYDRYNEPLEVDAVVLNGGMSKLYLVKNRIKEFFNLEPITTADPDLSVANGAAVYAAMKDIYHLQNHITIKRHVQNDDLYLGLSAGANDLLISTGDELPYTKTIEGYGIIPGTQAIEIPIKRGEERGEAQTIARGIITFSREYKTGADLKIEANFDQTGLLAIKAFLYNKSGVQIESGTVEFAIGAPLEKSRGGGRIIPVSGARLIPANEIKALKDLFSSKNRSQNKPVQVEIKMKSILNCGNPEEFEDVIIRYLSENSQVLFRYQLYKIVEKLSPAWSERGIAQIKEIAQKDIISDSFGFGVDERRKRLSDFVKDLMTRI